VTAPDRPPELPYPVTPGREPPTPVQPAPIPVPDLPEGDARRRLFDRRTVMVTGPLDRPAVNELCAQLMALDGESSRDVEAIVNSQGGPLPEVPAVLDVLGLMRAPVHTTCIGTARGTAAAILACGTGERRMTPSATVSLRCDEVESIEGSADDIRSEAEQLEAVRTGVVAAVATRTGMKAEAVAREMERGGWHGAEAARALGIVDVIRS